MDVNTDPSITAKPSEVFYDVAMRRLDEQLERADGLDSKLAQLFSFSSAVLPIFGALLTFAGDIGTATIAALVLAGVLYVGLAICVFLAYRVQQFSLRPRLDLLAEHCETYSEASIRRWVAQECVKSIKVNDDRLRDKGRFTQWSIACFAALSIVLTIATLITLIG